LIGAVLAENLPDALIHIIPVKKELGFIDGGLRAFVNAANDKIPIALHDGAGQLHGIIEFPAESLGQLAADNAGIALA